MGTIRKRLGCMLLTLVMCLGLLPGTAWAGTAPAALDIQNEIITSKQTSGGNLDSNGYHWEYNSDHTLNLQLKNANIGALTLPLEANNEMTITITLTNSNTIDGKMQFATLDTGSYPTAKSYKMEIKGTANASLTITDDIAGSGSSGDKITISGGVTVKTKGINIGMSGNSDSFLDVLDGSTLEVTGDGVVAFAGIQVKGRGTKPSVLKINGTLKVATAQNLISSSGPDYTEKGRYPGIYIDEGLSNGTSYIEIGTGSSTKPALYTEENATMGNDTKLYAVLAQLGKANCLPAELYDYENSQGKYSLVSFLDLSTGYYLCQTNNDGTPTLWTHLILKKNSASADDSSGSDDSDDSGSGSGSHRTHWYDIICNQPEHGSIEAPEKGYKNLGVEMTLTVDEGYILDKILVTNRDETETFKVRQLADGTYQFTMPAKDVLVTPILKEAPYILLTIDSCDAWVFTKMVTNDVAPVIRNARTMLPARFVIEALGGVVLWNQEAQEVTIFKDGSVMVIRIGAGYALIDGEVIALDSPAFIENDRTYLPIRFIAENMGAKVAWDAEKQTVKIVPER